jgi:hypothetical protein
MNSASPSDEAIIARHHRFAIDTDNSDCKFGRQELAQLPASFSPYN